MADPTPTPVPAPTPASPHQALHDRLAALIAEFQHVQSLAAILAHLSGVQANLLTAIREAEMVAEALEVASAEADRGLKIAEATLESSPLPSTAVAPVPTPWWMAWLKGTTT